MTACIVEKVSGWICHSPSQPPSVQNTPLLLLPMSPLLLLLLLPPVHADLTAHPGDCAPRNCTSAGPKISFPFWITSLHRSYCGHRLFAVACTANGSTTINISGETYTIHDIMYSTKNFSISMLHPPPPDGNCTFPSRSLSLPGFFQPSHGWLYFYSCNTSRPTASSCVGSSGRKQYVVAKQEARPGPGRNCTSPVQFPVTDMGSAADVMRQKFTLNWVGMNCTDCQSSGGECGYDSNRSSAFCICSDRIHSLRCSGSQEGATTKEKATVIIVVSSVSGCFLLLCLLYLALRRIKIKNISSLDNHQRGIYLNSHSIGRELGSFRNHLKTHIFSYEELKEATNNFAPSNEIGNGGFGTVYKGKLRDGRIVAVKELYESNWRMEQFVNEVSIFSCIRHKNLVSLYGCTNYQSRDLLLVYEYMPNGTVADHLHGLLTAGQALTWPMRMSIAIETAEVLAYLHAVEPPIIHRDIKTSNILLDDEYHVKVSDFGLSRLFPSETSYISTTPQGTPGYLDPEYHRCYRLTDKSDVYSFGVVLAELVSSKPAVDMSRDVSEINLADLTVHKVQKGLLEELFDEALGFVACGEIRMMMEEVAILAFRCLQPEKDLRPSMGEVSVLLKEIASEGKKHNHSTNRCMEVQEEACLLKGPVQSSPVTVHASWASRATTPNASN